MREGTEKYVWPSRSASVWGIRCIKGNRAQCWKTRLRTDPGGGQGEMWLEPTYLGVNRYWDLLMVDELYVIFVILPTYVLVSSDWDCAVRKD